VITIFLRLVVKSLGKWNALWHMPLGSLQADVDEDERAVARIEADVRRPRRRRQHHTDGLRRPTRQHTKYAFTTDGKLFYFTIGAPESDI
jgi:hypothetical protein